MTADNVTTSDNNNNNISTTIHDANPKDSSNVLKARLDTPIVDFDDSEEDPFTGTHSRTMQIVGNRWPDLSDADKKACKKLTEKDSEMELFNEMKAKRFEEDNKWASNTTCLSMAPVVNASVTSHQPLLHLSGSTFQGTGDINFPQ